MLRLLLFGAEEGAQEPQVLGHARRSVVPDLLGRLRRRRSGAALRAGEPAQLLAERGAEPHCRDGLRGNGPVDVDETADGEEAPRANSRQSENQHGCRDEDLVGKAHRAIPKLAQAPQSVTRLTPGNPLTLVTRVSSYNIEWLDLID